jgi:hypothetical protein
MLAFFEGVGEGHAIGNTVGNDGPRARRRTKPDAEQVEKADTGVPDSVGV